jgi:hypothetical protein
MSEDARAQWRPVLRSLIALAAMLTAGVHVYLAAAPSSPEPQLRLEFWLAVASYLGGLALLQAPEQLARVRPLGRLALLATAVASIVAYLIEVGVTFDMLALLTKIDEATLIVLVVSDAILEWRRSLPRQRDAGERRPPLAA